MAAGAQKEGLVEKPMAWLSPQGLSWTSISIPTNLEGRFTAVANNGEVTVLVGYDTSQQTGLIVRVPRGSDPLQVDFSEPVEFLEVVSTDSGFVAYGLTNPTSEDPRPALYISVEGSIWSRVDVLPLAGVVESIPGPSGYLLEIAEPGIGQRVRIRQTASLFDGTADQLYSWDLDLPTGTDEGFAYAMTGIATDGGFLIGGGEAVSGQPRLWEVAVPQRQESLTARLIGLERPADSYLNGRLIDVRHLTRSEEKLFAVVAALNGSVEAWSTTDTNSWTVEEKIGIDPSSQRYASAQSTTGEFPMVAKSGVPRTLVVTDGGFPGDLWAFGDGVANWSDADLIAYQQPVVPLFVGSADDTIYSRVVEHGPRWSQTEPDLVRTHLFSHQDTSWEEIGATAWDSATRIQSVVQLEFAAVALGTSKDRRGNVLNQVFPITEVGLGDPQALEGAPNGVELFSAAATDQVAVVVGADTRADGNRLVVWWSPDLEVWDHLRLEETDQSSIGAVCAGVDRIWVLGQRGAGFFSSARAWSSVDGATWAGSAPIVPGSDTPKGFTACAGDLDRVVAATASPHASLMITTDGLSWESTPAPPGLLVDDKIVEIALDGDRIGAIVQHPQDFYQPRDTPWLWDGDTWHQLDAEPGVETSSIFLRDGLVLLAGLSHDGPTVWQAAER
jgi:hypothetical protein